MGHAFHITLRSVIRSLAAMTPAKLKAWRRLIFTLSIFILVVSIFLIIMAIIMASFLDALCKLGYGPEFFILWMYLVGGSR